MTRLQRIVGKRSLLLGALSLKERLDDHTIDAVRKELLGGPLLGLSATFLLSERFGMDM